MSDPDSLTACVVRARDFARSCGLTDGVDVPSRVSPAREWAMPPVAPVLEQGGGIEGMMQRATAFIEQTIGAP